ncbi:MAG: RNA-protein complex protein Nop10 [Thermoproteales archaeon]|nr:RNA-protein complex protein Nop10 [Thermoproteales archaeon]RLE66215.1 MAG: RNA-protein complex protein Nop10 [Thermoprotei archaeon]
MTRIRKCKKCGRYTLQESCPACGSPTINPAPPRFSPQDKHGAYRRVYKKKLGVCRLPRDP